MSVNWHHFAVSEYQHTIPLNWSSDISTSDLSARSAITQWPVPASNSLLWAFCSRPYWVPWCRYALSTRAEAGVNSVRMSVGHDRIAIIHFSRITVTAAVAAAAAVFCADWRTDCSKIMRELEVWLQERTSAKLHRYSSYSVQNPFSSDRHS